MSRAPDQNDKVSIRDLGRKVRQTMGRVPFAADAMAAFFCARDPMTPKHVKAAVMGALAYFILPLDAVPDFIAGLGYTDDATVFYAAWRLLQPHLTDRHRAEARHFLEQPDGGQDAG
ncbi:MAG: YkvA family protein [Rhodospirillaceae bacterium]